MELTEVGTKAPAKVIKKVDYETVHRICSGQVSTSTVCVYCDL